MQTTAGMGTTGVMQRRHIASLAAGLTLAAWLGGTAPAAAERIPRDEAHKLQSPLPNSADAAREGRKTYLRPCQYCHGLDGRVRTNPDFAAPSLRVPGDW